MWIVRSSLLSLLAHVAIILASPGPDIKAVALSVTYTTDQITTPDIIVAKPSGHISSSSTVSSLTSLQNRGAIYVRDGPANAIISALCTNPASNFNTAILSSVSQFCIRFLSIKASTVQVTSKTTSTVFKSGTGKSVTTVIVRTTATITVTPPATTVTIPSTFTLPGSVETVTAPRSTITVIKTTTITTGVQKTIFTSTKTVTQTSYVSHRKRHNAESGILANYADSVISTVCRCLVTTPTSTQTLVVTITKTVKSTDASLSTSYTTITDKVTTELDEFTKSIFTTITFPGEDDTTTVTSSPATVTRTVTKTVTTTNTVKTITTTTTRIRVSTR